MFRLRDIILVFLLCLQLQGICSQNHSTLSPNSQFKKSRRLLDYPSVEIQSFFSEAFNDQGTTNNFDELKKRFLSKFTFNGCEVIFEGVIFLKSFFLSHPNIPDESSNLIPQILTDLADLRLKGRVLEDISPNEIQNLVKVIIFHSRLNDWVNHDRALSIIAKELNQIFPGSNAYFSVGERFLFLQRKAFQEHFDTIFLGLKALLSIHTGLKAYRLAALNAFASNELLERNIGGESTIPKLWEKRFGPGEDSTFLPLKQEVLTTKEKEEIFENFRQKLSESNEDIYIDHHYPGKIYSNVNTSLLMYDFLEYLHQIKDTLLLAHLQHQTFSFITHCDPDVLLAHYIQRNCTNPALFNGRRELLRKTSRFITFHSFSGSKEMKYKVLIFSTILRGLEKQLSQNQISFNEALAIIESSFSFLTIYGQQTPLQLYKSLSSKKRKPFTFNNWSIDPHYHVLAEIFWTQFHETLKQRSFFKNIINNSIETFRHVVNNKTATRFPEAIDLEDIQENKITKIGSTLFVYLENNTPSMNGDYLLELLYENFPTSLRGIHTLILSQENGQGRRYLIWSIFKKNGLFLDLNPLYKSIDNSRGSAMHGTLSLVPIPNQSHDQIIQTARDFQRIIHQEQVLQTNARLASTPLRNVSDYLHGKAEIEELKIHDGNAMKLLMELKEIDQPKYREQLKEAGLSIAFSKRSYQLRKELLQKSQSQITTAEAYTFSPEVPEEERKWEFWETRSNWIPERQELHERLFHEGVRDCINLSKRLGLEKSTLILMRGNTASGKSTKLKTLFPNAIDANGEITGPINPDVQKAILRTQERDEATNLHTISFAQSHWEGSMLSYQIMRHVLKETQASIVIDKRLDKTSSITEFLNLAINPVDPDETNGTPPKRQVHIIDMEVGLEHSIVRVLQRNINGDDPIPPFVPLAQGFINTRVNRASLFEQILSQSHITRYELIISGIETPIAQLEQSTTPDGNSIRQIIYTDDESLKHQIGDAIGRPAQQVYKDITGVLPKEKFISSDQAVNEKEFDEAIKKSVDFIHSQIINEAFIEDYIQSTIHFYEQTSPAFLKAFPNLATKIRNTLNMFIGYTLGQAIDAYSQRVQQSVAYHLETPIQRWWEEGSERFHSSDNNILKQTDHLKANLIQRFLPRFLMSSITAAQYSRQDKEKAILPEIEKELSLGLRRRGLSYDNEAIKHMARDIMSQILIQAWTSPVDDERLRTNIRSLLLFPSNPTVSVLLSPRWKGKLVLKVIGERFLVPMVHPKATDSIETSIANFQHFKDIVVKDSIVPTDFIQHTALTYYYHSPVVKLELKEIPHGHKAFSTEEVKRLLQGEMAKDLYPNQLFIMKQFLDPSFKFTDLPKEKKEIDVERAKYTQGVIKKQIESNNTPPMVAIDPIVELWKNGQFEGLVLVKWPNSDQLSVPGGFTRQEEAPEQTLIRTVEAKTNLKVEDVEGPIRIATNPNRDPEAYIWSPLYVVKATGRLLERKDFKTHFLPASEDITRQIQALKESDLWGDHLEHLESYVRYMKNKRIAALLEARLSTQIFNGYTIFNNDLINAMIMEQLSYPFISTELETLYEVKHFDFAFMLYNIISSFELDSKREAALFFNLYHYFMNLIPNTVKLPFLFSKAEPISHDNWIKFRQLLNRSS